MAIIIKPATLIKFHRALVKRKSRRLFSNKSHQRPGPKGPSRELIAAIVRRVLARHFKPKLGNGQDPSWLSLLGHSKDSLWSIDLFRCESLTLKSYWVLVVMDQWSRRIIGFGVHRGNVDGIAVCRMFNHAISGADPPRYLSSDNDPLFRFHRWRANLRILDVEEVKSVPYTPMSHPFIERVIGTIRREFLDDVPFWNSLDLEQKLSEFKDYYNNHRTHTALFGHSPEKFGQLADNAFISIDDYGWKQHCRGLFHTPTHV